MRGEIEAMASAAMLPEYEEVLRRDDQLASFWASSDEVSVVLGVLAPGELVRTFNLTRRGAS